MTVLIIDDCQVDRVVLKRTLEKVCADIVIFCAESIEEAISLLMNDIELVFLDLSLPAMAGLDFLSRTQLKVPIIVVSGYADIKTISKAMEQGASEYLIKPIQKKLLVDMLTKLGFIGEPKCRSII